MSLRIASTGTELEAVCALHALAFTASEHGHHGEAELVRALHADGDALVSLSAWAGEALAGHVLFSRMSAEADGMALSVTALAPVAVLPEFRCRGIAATLIAAGHAALAGEGVDLCFVLGDPTITAVSAIPWSAPRPSPAPMPARTSWPAHWTAPCRRRKGAWHTTRLHFHEWPDP